MKRIDHYFVQNRVCEQEQPRLTAAEPSKQTEIHVDGGEHIVDIDEADDDHRHGVVSEVSQVTSKACNETRSDELCMHGSGKKFQFS